MTYLENKINIFKNLIGDLYYFGCLDYTEIYIIALIYFKNNITHEEITPEKVRHIVHEEINDLIDLD